jgi:adenosine 3'-phospho 5'-phosphosulfate transporter B2
MDPNKPGQEDDAGGLELTEIIHHNAGGGGDDDTATLLNEDRMKPQIEEEDSETFTASALKLLCAFCGLQVSYVTWGFLQEIIMTTNYQTGMFPSSMFLVAANRFWAFIVAACVGHYKRSRNQLPEGAPLTYFSPSSMSNVISSYSQYEALKYVTFPTQVLFKSSKVIPVMLVGKLLHGNTYQYVEYAEACILCLGISIFMLTGKSSAGEDDEESSSSLYGILLLVSYVLADSFTSQWQSHVFKKHDVDQFQMMFGVNFWSLCFTTVSLVFSGGGYDSLVFVFNNADCMAHVLVLSLCSASGQLFIFYTIKKYGPIVFTIIMTTRQIISMVLSTVFFGHAMGVGAFAGALVVFCTLFYRTRRGYLKQKAKAEGN